MAGEVISCPGCSEQIELPRVASPKIGFLSSLAVKYRQRKEHKAHLTDFKSELFQAVSDGMLTESELQQLCDDKERFGVSDGELSGWGKSLFEAAVRGARAAGHISPERQTELLRIQEHLNLNSKDATLALIEVHRSRKLYDIQQGNLTPIEVPGLVPGMGELAYWSEPGRLYEERVLRRHYEGSSQGISIRIMKGVSFRVGNHRGNLVAESGDVPISDGRLIITNQRLVFQGDRKSFATGIKKIFELNPFLDGLRFSETGKQNPRLIGFLNPNGDFVCEVLSYVFRSRDATVAAPGAKFGV